MTVSSRLIEKLRADEPLALPLAALLTAATPFVRAGMALRLCRPAVRVAARVISFGNITAGGTGKTPAVIERARAELAAGRKVAVLTRGYGSARKGPPILLVRGAEAASAWDRVGDEPALIGRKVPDALIAKGADRAVSARLAIERHGCDTLILDDGFQYVRLARDENVLVVDATNPFGNGRLIPRGLLREPLEAMARATHVIVTRCDQVKDTAPLLAVLREHCPAAPIRLTRHAPVTLRRVADGLDVPLESLRGASVAALCAIANPNAFVATLEALGATVTTRRTFPDHATIPSDAFSAPGTIITTEKDAVRMQHPPDNVLALGIELRDV